MKSALPSTTIIVATLYAFSAVADGSNNSIELDLQGDRLKPEITQDGNDNTTKLKLVTTAPQQAGGPPVDISNGQNAATIIQRGNKNFADVSQTLTPLAPNLFQGQTMELNQLGNSNRATIKSNIQTSMDPGRKATHIQQGDNNTLDVNYVSTTFDRTIAQVGNGNKLSITNIGDYYKFPASTITQTGDNNTASSLSGTNATILQTGNTNNAKMHSTTVYPVSIQQKGDMNNADLWASGPMMMGGGSGIVQEGRSNYASLNAKSTGIALQQKGNSNTAIGTSSTVSNYTQTGSGNALSFNNKGGYQEVMQNGNGNTVNTLTSNGYTKIVQNGNANYASAESAQGNNIFLQQTGHNNSSSAKGNGGTIVQEGNSNRADMSMTIGRDSSPSVNQVGNNNVATGSISNAYFDAPAGIYQKGDNNTVKGAIGATPYNSVKINQIGSFNKVDAVKVQQTINQTGDMNQVSGNILTNNVHLEHKIVQNGTGNKAAIYGLFDGKTSNKSTAGSSLLQVGQANTVDLTNNGTDSNVQNVKQDGKKNLATQFVSGEQNTLNITQTGDANTATQNATGNFNELSILQNGSGNVASQIFTGNSNKSTISQTGTNHAANLNITGNSNNFNITQEGAGQKFSMNRVGNGMTMNIVQK